MIIRKLGSLFKKIGEKLISISTKPNKIQDIQAVRVKPWFAVNGDQTLRLDYDLNETSVIFDLGGYKGDWSSDIFNKYACNIYIFEPYQPYFEEISFRFSNNQKIKYYNFGLSKSDDTLRLNVSDDRSSTFIEEGDSVQITLKNVLTFLSENDINQVDLMKINIEGGEFDLLEALVNDPIIKSIKNIQVQFHDFVPDAEIRMRSLQAKLQETHQTTYQFEFVWENWSLKPIIN
ncbi:hypothetical protein D3C87_153740 [compost metagenome]